MREIAEIRRLVEAAVRCSIRRRVEFKVGSIIVVVVGDDWRSVRQPTIVGRVGAIVAVLAAALDQWRHINGTTLWRPFR